MRKTLLALFALLILPLTFAITLEASEVKKMYPETPMVGNEPAPFQSNGTPKNIPSPTKLFQVGTVVDSTTYDYQANSTLHQRIAAIGDSALHVSCMVSPDAAFATRGDRYIYYINGVFTNFGYVEGSGSGNQRGGYGTVVPYYSADRGIGNAAVMASHTNLDGRTFPQLMHWYGFQDAFQGVGAFSPYEGDYGDGFSECDDYLWPSIHVVNDLTGHMAMTAITFNNPPCTGGFDDIKVTHKTYDATTWDPPVLLDTLEDPTAWASSPNIPMLAGDNDGNMYVVSCDFGTNVYYWHSTDYGVTWGDRLDVTGFPIIPHVVPVDTSSNEYRPLQNSAISVSPDGTPHIVWTAYQALGILPDSLYTPGVDAVYQYRTKLEHWDPVNGVTTIFRHEDQVSNFAGGTQFCYNVGHPTIGFDETGANIYVVYEGFVDADQDFSNGSYYGDIYVSASSDGGATWDDRINITNSLGSDDLYPDIARVNKQGIVQELPGFSIGDPDGVNDFVIVYLNDDVAGTFVQGEETSANFDMVLVAPVDFFSHTGIGDDNGGPEVSLPRSFALGQNYPNPFNPSTSISYQLAEQAQVSIKIHNVRGQMVKNLVDGVKEAGEYTVQWNGRDEIGLKVSSGIYLYVLETDNGFKSTRKMVVLK